MRVTGITIFGGWHPHPNFYIFDAYGVRGDGSVIKICQHISATLALHAYEVLV